MTQTAIHCEKEQRRIRDFYASDFYQALLQRCPVEISSNTVAGVYIELFTPQTLIANPDILLINLHGGGFVADARTASHLESIPVAAVSGYQVLSIDYRQGPDYCFPAATDDIFQVYQALIQDRDPQHIGLFGCSAGATLVAQTLARLQQEGLPLPAATALSCHGAGPWDCGESWQQYLNNNPEAALPAPAENPYFKGVELNSADVFPSLSDTVMAGFPPTFLASATGDFALSPVLQSHAQLLRLGVSAELHLWDSVGHAFHYDAALDASQDYYQRLADFFQRHLI